MARECVERGYHLSFAGTVTFKNAEALRDALRRDPARPAARRDRRAVPHAPPATAGRPTRPYLVPLTVRAMAGVLNVDVPTPLPALSRELERVYGPW